jgi:hypothetical protein
VRRIMNGSAINPLDVMPWQRTSDDGKANIGCGVSDDGKARIGSVVSVDGRASLCLFASDAVGDTPSDTASPI